jgi:hypothetical protein
MIARFDHRPMLTALLALTTTVLVVVVVTLSTLLITSAPTASPTSVGDSGNPADLHGKVVAAAAPANQIGDARGSYFSKSDDSVDRHAEVVAAAAHTGLRPTRVWTPEARLGMDPGGEAPLIGMER